MTMFLLLLLLPLLLLLGRIYGQTNYQNGGKCYVASNSNNLPYQSKTQPAHTQTRGFFLIGDLSTPPLTMMMAAKKAKNPRTTLYFYIKRVEDVVINSIKGEDASAAAAAVPSGQSI